MAIKMTKRKWCGCVGDYRKDFIVDTDADFAYLPSCCTGSTALSLATGHIRVVNTFGEWVAFGKEG